MNGININLTITSPDLHNAFLALAEAINRHAGATPQFVPDPTVSKLQQGATKLQYEEEAARVEVVPAKAPNVPNPDNPPAEAAPEPESAYTLEDVRKLSMDKSKKDKAAVKAAIAAVGAAKVTEVDPAKYPEFVAILEAI